MSDSQIGVQCQSAPKRSNGDFVVLLIKFNHCRRDMSLSNRIVQHERAVDRSPGILNPLRSRTVTIIELQVVTICDECIGESKIRVLLNSSSKMVDRFLETIPRSRIPKVKAHQILVIGAGICGVTFCQLLLFITSKIKRKRSDDIVRNCVLNTKDVSEDLVEFVRPDSTAARDLDKLDSSANLVTGSLDSSTQDSIHSERAACSKWIIRGALVFCYGTGG